MNELPHDLVASLVLFGALALAVGLHFLGTSADTRALVAARVDREAPLPLLGRAPMRAVYRALVPFARGLVELGVSANSVSIASAAIAVPAAIAFGTGHFGVAALVASVAALADGLDGLVARLSGTTSRLGQVLDTTIDRYVDVLFVGGIALYVRFDAALLLLALAAIVGGFMVSYASSVERERGIEPGPAPMRRAHRLTLLLVASAVAPFVALLLGDVVARAELVPVCLAIGTIALVGNVTAVSRLIRAGTAGETSPPEAEIDHDVRNSELSIGANEGE